MKIWGLDFLLTGFWIQDKNKHIIGEHKKEATLILKRGDYNKQKANIQVSFTKSFPSNYVVQLLHLPITLHIKWTLCYTFWNKTKNNQSPKSRSEVVPWYNFRRFSMHLSPNGANTSSQLAIEGTPNHLEVITLVCNFTSKGGTLSAIIV